MVAAGVPDPPVDQRSLSRIRARFNGSSQDRPALGTLAARPPDQRRAALQAMLRGDPERLLLIPALRTLPEADLVALIDDWLVNTFGPAAGPAGGP